MFFRFPLLVVFELLLQWNWPAEWKPLDDVSWRSHVTGSEGSIHVFIISQHRITVTEKKNTFIKHVCQSGWQLKTNSTVVNPKHIETVSRKSLTNWRQFFMRLSCYWSWISSSHCFFRIVKVAVDPRGDSWVDPQTTLTMWWRNSWSITGQTH